MSGLRAQRTKGTLRRGWSATVGDYAIAGDWACDGDLMVVGDAAGGVYGFEGSTGAVRWSQDDAHEGGLLSMAVQPGGAMFATVGQDGRVLLWDARRGQVTSTVSLGRGWVEHVAWSSDGALLAVSLSRHVHVINTDGQEVWRSEAHPSTVSAIAWSGTKELATACYGRVSFFEASSGALRQKLEWKGSLVSIALSPNGEIVACGSQDNSVHFWRRSTGQDSMMSGYPGKPSALAFDSSGTLLATGGGMAVTVWSFQGDGPEGTRPGVLDRHKAPITVLSFARRGATLASGARDGAVVIWSLKKDGRGRAVGSARVGDVISDLAWRPDGRALAALDANGAVTAWRVSSR